MDIPNIDGKYKVKYKDIVIIKKIAPGKFCVQESDIRVMNELFHANSKKELIVMIEGQEVKRIYCAFFGDEKCRRFLIKLNQNSISFLLLDLDDTPLKFMRFDESINNYQKTQNKIARHKEDEAKIVNKGRKKTPTYTVDPKLIEANKSLKSESRLKTKQDIEKWHKSKETLHELFVNTSSREKLDRTAYTPSNIRKGVKKTRY